MSRVKISRRRIVAGASIAAAVGCLPGSRASADTASSRTASIWQTDSNAWWSWRGPAGNNIADPSAKVFESVDRRRTKWTVNVPGRGHSSPLVTSDRVYLTTHGSNQQVLLGVDRETSKPAFSKVIHQGGVPTKNHPKNTEASSTPAFDGKNLFVAFYNDKAIRLTSLTQNGEIRWQKSVAPYSPQQYKYGYAASPVLYQNLVIVAAEMDLGSQLVALDRDSGSEVWRAKRPEAITFSSPIVGNVAGRDQLLISGAYRVVSYDPRSGQENWSADATTMATCGTMVWNQTHVFASGGYPDIETVCVRADGSGDIEWSLNRKCYEQSMLLVGDYLYAITDSAVAECWRCSDGKTMWRQRLSGKWSSSPILSGNIIHAFNEAGEGWSFEANPRSFVQCGACKIGDEAFATPAIVGDTMYMRVADREGGRRRERLLALT